MRMLTLNLFGHHREWPRRRAVLADGLRRCGPDIALFQECVVTRYHDQAADLLGTTHDILHARLRGADGSGVSIASRWPLGESHEIDLRIGHRVTDFPAVALAADVHLPGGEPPLLVVNHRPSWRPDAEDERRVQAAATVRIVEAIVSRSRQSVLLGGDLDADPEAPSVRFWHHPPTPTGARYLDMWRLCHPGDSGPTYAASTNPLVGDAVYRAVPSASRLRDRRIDYLFVRCGPDGSGMKVENCERVFTEPSGGVWASDHFGLLAEVE